MPTTTNTTPVDAKALFADIQGSDLTQLPAPYNTFARISVTDPSAISIHNNDTSNPRKTAILNRYVIQALLDYVDKDNSKIGIVRLSEGSYASQWTAPDGSTILAHATANGVLTACKRAITGRCTAINNIGNRNNVFDCTSILVLYLLIEADLNKVGVTGNTITPDFLNDAVQEFAANGELSESTVRLVNDDLVFGLKYGAIPCGIRNGAIDLLTAQRLQNNEFDTGVVIRGNPDLLKTTPSVNVGASADTVTVKAAKEMVSDYTATLHWTPEEEELIPVFDDNAEVAPEIIKVIKRFIKSRDLKVPMNNFMWRGITGYGKSTGVEMMACILHTPYLYHTCSTNTEENDFLCQFVPNSSLTSENLFRELPTFEDIENDPVSAYEQLTGKAKDDASPEEALQAYGAAIAARSGGAHFKLVESDFIRALTNGYIVEVQEFSRIRDSGVLVKLNAFDKPGAIIPLVNGNHVRRHKNAIVFYTDNVGYVSCRPVDPSFLRRQSFIIDSHDMPMEKAIGRIQYRWLIDNNNSLFVKDEIVSEIDPIEILPSDLIFFPADKDGEFKIGIITKATKQSITYVTGDVNCKVSKITTLLSGLPDDVSIIRLTQVADTDLYSFAWFLCNELNLNPAGACGILANIQIESGCKPYVIGDAGTSFGICQWRLGRWDRLVEFCDANGYGTPLESTTYKFAKCLQKRFGIIPGVTDHQYITNSYHVCVREKINAFDKLAKEAEFQRLSPGGAISYVEVPNLQQNLEAVMTIIKFIYDNIMYAEINTKSDYCQVCGFDGEIKIVEDNGKLIWECPQCKNRDQHKMNVARRTCGYIGTQYFNQGRTQEIKDRVLHVH